MDQWNPFKDPSYVSPHMYEDLIFHKEWRNTHWKKASTFNKWCWSNWMSAWTRMQRSLSITLLKSQVQLDKKFNIQSHRLNLMEENIRNSLELTGIDEKFQTWTPIAQTLRSATNKSDIIKMEGCYTAKGTVNRTKPYLT